MAEAFPPALMHADALREVLEWIRVLPVNNRAKKAAVYEWCVEVGVALRGWMVAYVTGRPAGEV